MKQTLTRIFLPLLFAMLAISAAFAAPTVSFTTAKAKAAREGKVLLVDFTASWCMPCKWMDQTTFSDPQVLQYLTDHYVSIKIDIDDFDGFALKQQFHVETLPTIIFFSSEGKQLDRVSEGIGASELLSLLNYHNKPSNRRKLGGEAPSDDWNQPFAKMSNTYAEEEEITAPVSYIMDDAVPTPQVESTAIAFSEAFSENDEFLDVPRMAMSVPAIETRAVASLQFNFETQPSKLQVQDVKAPLIESEELDTEMPEPDVINEAFVLDAAKLERTAQSNEPSVSMAPDQARMFSLQAGAFSNQENAIRAADHLRDYTENPVLIEFDIANEKPIYRIYVGRFTDLKDAEEVSKKLYMHGFSCIPKELAMR